MSAIRDAMESARGKRPPTDDDTDDQLHALILVTATIYLARHDLGFDAVEELANRIFDTLEATKNQN